MESGNRRNRQRDSNHMSNANQREKTPNQLFPHWCLPFHLEDVHTVQQLF